MTIEPLPQRSGTHQVFDLHIVAQENYQPNPTEGRLMVSYTFSDSTTTQADLLLIYHELQVVASRIREKIVENLATTLWEVNDQTNTTDKEVSK